MPGRNTGQEKVFAFSIVYLTGCTPKSSATGFLSSLKQDEGWRKRVGKRPLRPLMNKAVFEGLAEGQPVKSGGSLAPADTLSRT